MSSKKEKDKLSIILETTPTGGTIVRKLYSIYCNKKNIWQDLEDRLKIVD